VEAQPFVSFVTPFYNTREFLPECIESVLRQSYQNWEYVLVDNCSTDGSREIAAGYANRYPNRIRVIQTKSFLSQVQNYNFALSCISPSSKYCKVVQADDWLFPECVIRMVELAEAHPSVGIVAAYQFEGDEVLLNGLPYPSPEVSGRDACRLYFLKNKYLFGSPTSSLIRSEAVRSRQPFYDERHAPFEDAHVCFDLLRTWNFGFVHQVLTCSRCDNNGLLSQMRPFAFWLFARFSFVVEHGRHYLSAAEYARCYKQVEREYFLYLATSACAVHPQAPEFWEFHRQALTSIDYVLDWKKLARWFPRAVIEKAWGAFWTRWDKVSSATSADPRRFISNHLFATVKEEK